MADTLTQAVDGPWPVAIPEPYYGIRKGCVCGRKFWTYAGYQGHWLLEHYWRRRGYLVGDMQAYNFTAGIRD